MKTLLILLLVLAVLFLLLLLLLRPDPSARKKMAPFVGRRYAHRGLHCAQDGIPENSLPAFRRAVEAGYGIELDLHLTTDGQLVVFHDDTLDRVCGVTGRVDEKSYAELQQLRLLGTEERIPLFSEVLDIVAGKIPMIVEVKYQKNYPRPLRENDVSAPGLHRPVLCRKLPPPGHPVDEKPRPRRCPRPCSPIAIPRARAI